MPVLNTDKDGNTSITGNLTIGKDKTIYAGETPAVSRVVDVAMSDDVEPNDTVVLGALTLTAGVDFTEDDAESFYEVLVNTAPHIPATAELTEGGVRLTFEAGADANDITLTPDATNEAISFTEDTAGVDKILIPFAGGVKVYRALLTQAGTAAPVATVLENSLGGTVVWSYDGPGVYDGTLTGAFLVGKTFLVAGEPNSIDGLIQLRRSTDNAIELLTNIGGDGTDGQLYETTIEILVYP